MAKDEPVITNQNPHAVDPALVDQPMRKVGDTEVSAEPLKTDIAGVRADDPPAVAAEKIARAHEKIADMQKDAGTTGKSSAAADQAGSTKSFTPAGTNKTASKGDSTK